ncbi:unnamed protein product [Prorocentrum cordatum]|uniref:Uncharacterized protein n=1 Tax=Prorocentrum cordatum TaxID=2364126 RepID=A0ABN9YAK6_9DINO|nr:unnamed protein product [Polarella glacialis]|mmetsp:Transcript_100213/g.264701  ORF Transcript_100213/g.264701 Transcript_100213/m.264701 type:complete len:287 (+) Transcript_100213:77-937(+)
MAAFSEWACACEKVKISTGNNFSYLHGDCCCDDCNIRHRVAADKYCGPADKKQHWTSFAPNDTVELYGAYGGAMEVTSGRENIGYFRCGIDSKTGTWSKKHPQFPDTCRTVTLYAKCCGVWIGFHGPPNSLVPVHFEMNPRGLSGWTRKEEADGFQYTVFSTKFVDTTGVKLNPPLKKGDVGRMPPFRCCGCGTGTMCGLMPWLCCSKMDAAKCCMCCPASCCPCIAGKIKDSAFESAPPGATELNGKQIEYICDLPDADKYLKFPLKEAALSQAPLSVEMGKSQQ